MGRKPTDPTPRREAAIFVRLTPDEHAQVASNARAKGLGISAYVRMVLTERMAAESKNRRK